VIHLDPYDSCQRKAIKRGERNFITAQKAYKEFAAAAEIVLWDLQEVLKPAFDNVAQYMDALDELDQDALLTMATKDDAKAILLLQALANMAEHGLPGTADLLKVV
jgi:ABC-type Zn uptake system ZnuABC Zn-binding protein ZnuA